MRLIGLLTTYEDADWLPNTLRSLEQLDGGVIIEGAYQETIKLGKSPRSQDGTNELCRQFVLGHTNSPLYVFSEKNEESDVQQRNAGLQLIKEYYPGNDTVMMIIDGDEEYAPEQIQGIRRWADWLSSNSNYLAGIIWSQVYTSTGEYVLHAFPRLFRITPGCKFINDNYLCWPEYNYEMIFSDREQERVKVLPYPLATTHHSYQISKVKFDWKSAGRVARWGAFPWYWDQKKDCVTRDSDIIFWKGYV